ncbi:hypothetical protein N7495_006239 [Penicillium taxi]|uniref:uncharacterized protein n=1 Tax=Penicillium taxi TaxID=168475 RepID=UPI002544F9D0|nr:uncharacterized protein N7495_006239 [Penicillium taxi]KAJ5894548.1 hypothetical protein N7495_006239 [Penicillium taxi]
MALTLVKFLTRFSKWKRSEKIKNENEKNDHQPSANDRSLWINEVGSMLTDMLIMAGYPSLSESIHTKFFHESVAQSLGPHPRGRGSPDSWKSFMTDDHTPVELSWCWSTSLETPTVRYSVEPIGPFAGKEIDPINTAASLRLLGDTLPLAPGLDLSLHQHFQRMLSSRSDPFRVENEKLSVAQSQSFMAFDLLETSIIVKQYYLPERRALAEDKTKLFIIEDVFQNLPTSANALMDSVDMFRDFLSSFPGNSQPAVEIIAIDCLDPSHSRLKIYVRSRSTSLASAIHMLSLGGRAPKTREEEDSLRELWCSVFGLDPKKYHDYQPLRGKEHRTAGILYYFELKQGTKAPKSKVYLPVRHYAQSDEQISRGLSDYLARRGKKLAKFSYYDGVKRLW